MSHLIPVSSVSLGTASVSPPPSVRRAAHFPGWEAEWVDDQGRAWRVEAPLTGGTWSTPQPSSLAWLPPTKPAADGAVFASVRHGSGSLVLRAGRRVVGTRPRFPSAGLVLSQENAGHHVDVAFVDDAPDQAVVVAALAVDENHVAAVYVVKDDRQGLTCRVFRFTLNVAPARSDWTRLADYPHPPGVAGVIAGTHEGVLIAGGGANFPDLPPWENGVKRYYDELYFLRPGATAWESAGRLPQKRGYAAMLSFPEGILALGGENAEGLFADSLWLRWNGRGVTIEPGPKLPEALTNAMAVTIGSTIYLAGGFAMKPQRVTTAGFYSFDLAKPAAGWRTLPAWSGSSRALAVMGALGGQVYVLSGLESVPGPDGVPVPAYLSDAHRYSPASNTWERLPDLPWSVIAAPSPAPVTETPPRLFLLGGVDGRQVGKLPRENRVPEDILFFDPAKSAWRLWSESWVEPMVTPPAIRGADAWYFVSGETMAGRRSMVVQAWRPDPGPGSV